MPASRLVQGFLGGVVLLLWAAVGSAGWYQDANRSFYIDLPGSWLARAWASDSERFLAAAAPDGTAAVRVHVAPAEPATRAETLKAAFESAVAPGARQVSPPASAGQQTIEAQYAWYVNGAAWTVNARFLVAEKLGRMQAYTVWSMLRDGAPPQAATEAQRMLESFSLQQPRGALDAITSLPETTPGPATAFLLGDLRAEQTPAAPSPAPPQPQPQPQAPPPPQPLPQAPLPPPLQPQPADQPQPPQAPPSPPPPAPLVPGQPPQQPEAPAERPEGPSRCLDATDATECGCAVGDLRPAFADLEQAFVKTSPASGELRNAAARIRDETANTGGNCPAPVVARATALAERLEAPEARWIAERLELLKICADRTIARLARERGRPGLNRTLDAAIAETRMVKYDTLLLLAEIERLRAERDDATALVGEVLAGCRIVQNR